jgi:hypothetical protein
MLAQSTQTREWGWRLNPRLNTTTRSDLYSRAAHSNPRAGGVSRCTPGQSSCGRGLCSEARRHSLPSCGTPRIPATCWCRSSSQKRSDSGDWFGGFGCGFLGDPGDMLVSLFLASEVELHAHARMSGIRAVARFRQQHALVWLMPTKQRGSRGKDLRS